MLSRWRPVVRWAVKCNEVITDDQMSAEFISTLRENWMVVHVAATPASVGEYL
jgi:hypothetical protein